MTILSPTALLGGLSPQRFMQRHWQKRPLLVRAALPGFQPVLSRASLFELAGRDEVESRLVERRGDGWKLRHGPFGRRALPPLSRPGWTLLVQGVDLHHDAAHALLSRFRFVPDARLDDLMVSYASDGGGVGPHVDSYDVFLLQAEGQRRWRIGRQRDLALQAGEPLKILQRFEPEEEWLLDPGDMLYLPPRWAHEGVAEGPCMTCSIGFHASRRRALAGEVLQAMLDHDDVADDGPLYADPAQRATDEPGRIPDALQAFALSAVRARLRDDDALGCSLGEVLTTPKPQVVFEGGGEWREGVAWRLDRRSRMMYDAQRIYLNGESFKARGRDAQLMRRLADRRLLDSREAARLGRDAKALVGDWSQAGWLHAVTEGEPDG